MNKTDQKHAHSIGIPALLLTVLAASLLLTGCMPNHYSSEQKKKVEKEHAADAESWFAANLSEAKMKKNVEAYTSGLDLFCAIRGTYEYGEGEYPFIYDYYNGDMYLGHDMEAITEHAAGLISKELGVESSRMDISFWGISFHTNLENDITTDYDSADSVKIEGLAPALVDPEEYAKELVYDSNNEFCIYVYGDKIPDYDFSVFKRMKGIDYLVYLQPVNFDYEGTYRVRYDSDSADYHRIKLQKFADDVVAGYFYCIREEYEEDGTLSNREDPLENNSINLNCLIDPKGKVSLMVPPAASPIVFVKKASAYTSQDGSSSQNWEDTYKQEYSFYPSDMDYINGTQMIVPHSNLFAYYISSRKSTRGEYNLQLHR